MDGYTEIRGRQNDDHTKEETDRQTHRQAETHTVNKQNQEQTRNKGLEKTSSANKHNRHQKMYASRYWDTNCTMDVHAHTKKGGGVSHIVNGRCTAGSS